MSIDREDSLRNRIREIDAERQSIMQELKNIRTERNREIAQSSTVLRDLNFAALSFSYGMECPDSPNGLCIYDTDEDPMRDECLFCEDPLERG